MIQVQLKISIFVFDFKCLLIDAFVSVYCGYSVSDIYSSEVLQTCKTNSNCLKSCVYIALKMSATSTKAYGPRKFDWRFS